MKIGRGYEDRYLSEGEIRDILTEALGQVSVEGENVVVVIPDSTRTAPIPLMFRLFNELLGGRVAKLDFLVALGTHPIMSEEALNKLVGVTAEARATTYKDVGLFNHRWDLAETFETIGMIPRTEVEAISKGMLSI